ncbi:MAG: hypothetical protein PF501_03300 [Salinisphaera sp.]|nr:hypothetical protein [Salinisphaera sp.]
MRDYILSAYEQHGIDELASGRIGHFLQIRYGGTSDAKRRLGSLGDIRSAFFNIQSHLYR